MTVRTPLLALAALCLAVPPAATAGDVEIDGTFVSTAPTGTQPLEVDSTTHVPNLNADLLDGFDASAFLPAMSNVLLVAKSGGHFTSIQAALDSITSASQANPYLVLVGPGVYQEQVTMKPYVDIQGSGQGVTTISWAGGDLGQQTLLGASNAELRHLTVQNTGGGADNPWAILNQGASPTITHVTVTSQTTGLGAEAIRNVDQVFAAAPELTHVVAQAMSESAIAINNLGGSPLLYRVEAYANGENSIGISNTSSATPTLRHVIATANAGTGSGQAKGFAIAGGFAVLSDVEVSASGANTNWGLLATGSSDVELTRAKVSAIGNGGSTCYAIQTIESDLTLQQGESVASGCNTANQAIRSDRSDVVVRNSRVSASSATSYAVYNYDSTAGGGPCTVEAHSSQVIGWTNAVNTATDCTTKIGASLLGGSGTTTGAGTHLCAGVYDEAMTFTTGTGCP